jgi:outer membrane protein
MLIYRTMRTLPILALLALYLFCSACGSCLATPLTLAEGLKLLRAENKLVKIRNQDEAIARAETKLAGSRLIPHINASFNQFYIEHQPVAIFGPQHIPTAQSSSYRYRVMMQQLLFDFGGALSLYQSGKLLEQARAFDTRNTENSEALNFTAIYFDLLESEKAIEVAKIEVDALKGHAGVAKELFDEGVITKNDLLQAQIKLSDAEQRRLTAQNLREVNAARLNALLSRPISTDIEAAEIFRERDDVQPIEGALRIAEKERPELQMLDLTMQAVDLQERAQRSEYFPRFFFEGGFDYAQNKYVVHEGNWVANFMMSYDLFSGGAKQAEMARLRSTKTKVRLEREKAVDDVRLQVKKYYLDTINAREKIRVAQGTIDQAEENLRINRIKYAEGVGTATDVTDAIALLTLSRTNYFRALYDYYRSEAGYLYAMGKDLQGVYR